jgi:hypothetical protein
MSSENPSYQALLDEISTVASNYSFGVMLKGFTPDLINLMMQNNLEKVKAASSYAEAVKVLNAALSIQLGVSMGIDQFITSEEDRQKLYALFATWRVRLLAESTV